MPLEYNSDSDSDASLDLTSTLIPTKSPSNVTATRLKDTTAAAVPLLGKQPRAGSNNTNSIGDMSAILDELVKAAADPRGRTSQDSESDSENEERNLIQRELIAQNRKMKKSGGFQSMGLSPFLFKAIIHKGFKVPTPIQRKTIPHIMEGQDVVGMARTGSGKTAAFVIPLIERLKAHSAKVGIRAVIMSPSRELVLQTLKVCKELGKYTDLRAVAVVGGDNMEEQFSMMASNPDIVVATPGRFLHLVVEMKLELKRVEYVVFDEADRLFEMGFSVQLHELLHRLPPSRQTLLFSATLPSTSVDFAKAGLNDPQLIRLDVDSKISKDLEMAFFNVKRDNKDAALLYLLREVIKIPISSTNQPAAAGTKGIKGAKKGKHPKREQQQGVEAARDDCDKQAPRPPNGQTIVFVATKHHVEYISHLLQEYGFLISYVYGSLDQTARQIQISRFRSGQTHIMVVTDVAARGIDIPILENVINYDFVDSSKVFVHRVGRVARAGRRGWAYSIVSPDELPYLIDLQLFLGRPLRLGSQEYKQQGAEPDYTNEVVLGQMPSSLLELNNEWVIRQLSESVTLQGLHKTATNGFIKYVKSKQTAAHESYRRAKELMASKAFEEPHIFLSKYINDDEQKRLEMVNLISNFRPSETIFEVGRRGTRNLTEAAVAMMNYRTRSDSYIAKTKAKRESQPDPLARFDSDGEDEEVRAASAAPSKYRDDDFYIPHVKPDANTEKGYSMTKGGSFAEQVQDAVLTIAGDDIDDLRRKQNALRWDSKKKKFVKGLGIGSDNKKLITGESGVKLPASFKSGTFDEWQKKTKVHFPRVGEQELPSASKFTPSSQNKRFRHNKVTAPKPLDSMSVNYERKLKKLKKTSSAVGGERGGPAAAKSELKTVDQIRKARMEKQKRQEKNARPSKRRGGKR